MHIDQRTRGIKADSIQNASVPCRAQSKHAFFPWGVCLPSRTNFLAYFLAKRVFIDQRFVDNLLQSMGYALSIIIEKTSFRISLELEEGRHGRWGDPMWRGHENSSHSWPGATSGLPYRVATRLFWKRSWWMGSSTRVPWLAHPMAMTPDEVTAR